MTRFAIELMVWMPLYVRNTGFRHAVTDESGSGEQDGGDLFAGDQPERALP
jgi:hypothetical protein